MISRAGNQQFEVRGAESDFPMPKESQVKAKWAVRTALQLHGASRPCVRRAVGRLHRTHGIAPCAIEGKSSRKAVRGPVSVEAGECGANLSRIRIAGEDEIDRILPDTGKVGAGIWPDRGR